MNAAASSFRPAGEHGYSLRGQPIPLRESRKSAFSNVDSRSQVPCRFFQHGTCREGPKCPYSHSKSPVVEAMVQSSAAIHAPSAEEKVTRTLGGALVHYEAGAGVSKISLPLDFSAVHISTLPHDSTVDSVRALLQSHDLDISKVRDIRVVREDNKLSSAVVKVEDPGFARLAGVKLGPQVVSRGGSLTSDAGALRVDCTKVRCSWHKACKTVWLNFGNGEVADRVMKKFKDGTYKIKDRTVNCTGPTRGGGRYNPKAWTVCLTEVPADATKADVSGSIHLQWDKPRDTQLGTPTYSTDAGACSAMVHSLFTAVGPLEWWELVPDTTGKRMKATARFQDEDDARTAAQTLNNSALPFNKAARLTVQLVHSAKFKVSSLIYEAVQSQIKARIRDWKALHIHFVVYENSDPPKWYRVLKIEGEVVKSVVEAKNTIASILAGTVAKAGSTALWHPTLRSHGALLEKVRQLQEQSGVAIVRNKAKSQLRLYGPPKKCEQVQTALDAVLGARGREEFVIELDTDRFLWACQGGFKRMASELGSDRVNLDIISNPKRIVITGTAKEFEAAMAMLGTEKALHSTGPPKHDAQDCSVCWTEAEDPIQTQCHHVYCLDCFENMCISAATAEGPAVQIRCAGESGNCAAVPSLQELQEHLSSAAFEELLEQSFAAYVGRHADSIKYCPSADCGYVYRVNDAAAQMQHTCPNCLVPVCAACAAQHGTMSCADYGDVSTGGYAAFERLKKEIGIKDCPRCQTPLEKTDGCNHMTCRCGAHICWVCLGVFPVAGDCYAHMNEKHGGIGWGYDHIL